MTQPAKVQEPSMEEILASIRRIIADDEAKPASADKPANDRPASVATPEKPAVAAAPAPKPVVKDIPPPPTPAAAKPAPAAPKPAPAPPPAKTNSQHDIDAMLASLDEATQEAEVRPPQPDGDVFELTDEMALPDPAPTPTPKPPPPTFQKVEPQDDIEFTEATKPPPSPPRQPAYEAATESSSYGQQPILSRTTMNAVESAFNSLANTVLSNNARTLEDLVKEMLRPMLKSWLDDNLPGLVERIVKAEIERVSRGR
ncbi:MULTISPECIES: PopZ family protein [unclassified Bradyrhizobium]